MAKKATKRRAWTQEHVRTLKALARKKTHAARIAKTLKRSEGATRQKAFSMGFIAGLASLISICLPINFPNQPRQARCLSRVRHHGSTIREAGGIKFCC
jgi:hypothetical protein